MSRLDLKLVLEAFISLELPNLRNLPAHASLRVLTDRARVHRNYERVQPFFE